MKRILRLAAILLSLPFVAHAADFHYKFTKSGHKTGTSAPIDGINTISGSDVGALSATFGTCWGYTHACAPGDTCIMGGCPAGFESWCDPWEDDDDHWFYGWKNSINVNNGGQTEAALVHYLYWTDPNAILPHTLVTFSENIHWAKIRYAGTADWREYLLPNAEGRYCLNPPDYDFNYEWCKGGGSLSADYPTKLAWGDANGNPDVNTAVALNQTGDAYWERGASGSPLHAITHWNEVEISDASSSHQGIMFYTSSASQFYNPFFVSEIWASTDIPPVCYFSGGHWICDDRAGHSRGEGSIDLPPGQDTEPKPTPAKRTSWGRVKAIYR